MKRVLLVGAALALALAITPTTAGAGDAGSGMVTIVHDATYSVDDPFPVTLCLDGSVVDSSLEFGDILGPDSTPVGSYDVAIYIGADQACEGEPDIGGTLDVAAGDDVTAAAIWTSEGPGLAVWPNDSSCYEADTSTRLTVRHGATTGGPVDVIGTVDGTETTIVSALAEGDQATVDLPGGITATGAAVVPAGGGATLIDLGDLTLEEGTHYVVYAGGGNDGDAGVFIDPIAMEPCETPTTTTTAPDDDVDADAAEAPAAAPVAAQPTFTG